MPGRFSLFLLGAALAACTQLNPSVPTPSAGELARTPGAWVAYNLGCKHGCEQIRRGDLITAIDGHKITSGAEVDAADLPRGTPVRLDLYRRGTGEALAVELVAEPYEYMHPIAHVPPLWTVGAEALDRAPGWARLKAFGHATPAMRLYQLDEPRAFVDGRDLFGRGALIVLWIGSQYKQQERMLYNDILPGWYAGLQANYAALTAAGVDAMFVFNGRVAEADRYDIRRNSLGTGEWSPDRVPMFANMSSQQNPNTRGLQHAAADFNELLFNDGRMGPIIVIIDPRGIVRWHSRGFKSDSDPLGTLTEAIAFAMHQLGDQPQP